jgi:hypothetical protein
MPAKDGFRPDDRFPLIRPEHAEEPEQPVIGKSWGRAVVSLRILKISVLAATAIGGAILLLRNPVEIFANVTDSPVDISALQPGTGQPTPSAGAEALLSTARNGTTRGEIAGAFEPADQGQTEIRQPSVEALLNQFQAWAADEETRAQVEPVPLVQDARVAVAQDAPAQVRPAQKHRQVRSMRNARAEIRRDQGARVQVRPVQDTQAQVQPVQNAQPPSLLRSLGLIY